jgi:hypothetical protein
VASELTLEIIGGDSKNEMLAQLQDIGRIVSKRRPMFYIQVQHPTFLGDLAQAAVGVHLNGIVAEDGSGNCWIIKGYIAMGTNWTEPFKNFEGFYNTKTRRGSLQPRS